MDQNVRGLEYRVREEAQFELRFGAAVNGRCIVGQREFALINGELQDGVRKLYLDGPSTVSSGIGNPSML
jgi:hypothetical protein